MFHFDLSAFIFHKVNKVKHACFSSVEEVKFLICFRIINPVWGEWHHTKVSVMKSATLGFVNMFQDVVIQTSLHLHQEVVQNKSLHYDKYIPNL